MKKQVYVYILAAIVALAMLSAGLFTSKRLTAWLGQRDALRRQVAMLTEETGRLRIENQQLQIEIDGIEAVKSKRDTVIKTQKIEVAATPVPDTCKHVVAIRDALIESLAADTLDLSRQFDKQKQMTANLQVSDSLKGATIDSAMKVVDHAPVRPSFWSYLKPELRVTVGPSIPLLGSRKTITPLAASIGASWKIPIP